MAKAGVSVETNDSGVVLVGKKLLAALYRKVPMPVKIRVYIFKRRFCR
jgi:hypothetical protein